MPKELNITRKFIINNTMNFFRALLISALILPIAAFAQRITYSLPERDDTRTLNFEIVGKISGNFLVYKNIEGKY